MYATCIGIFMPGIGLSSFGLQLCQLGICIMGRRRGKGKKLTITNDDLESGEEEKIHAQKRRGRPQKQLKDEIAEEESEKLEEEESEGEKPELSSKEVKSSGENGKRRKRNVQSKENLDAIKDENSNGTTLSAGESSKCNGFHSNGSRRKNKPRRAAEAGVEWK